jgi:hypothetical protein
MSAAALACGAAPAAKVPAPAPIATPVPTPASLPAHDPDHGHGHGHGHDHDHGHGPRAAEAATESPGFSAALASLRPSGTENALQALAATPTDAEAYAKAALAYAPTEVPGMALLWGLTYQAMGGGALDGAVAAALAQVLTERILAAPDAKQQATFHIRLAPGQMPTRQAADGAVQGPIAHVFESLFSPTVTGFRPPWTIEQFYDVLSTWVGLVATKGTPLDARLPLDGWLVVLAKAGHLEAFCYQLLGPAFPGELKAYQASDPKALKAYREFLKANPLRPVRAPMPDDLVRLK